MMEIYLDKYKVREMLVEFNQCLKRDIDDLMFFMSIKDRPLGSSIRTTNAIERRLVEVRRRCRPMGVFADITSMERILFAIFAHENKNQGVPSLFALTQNT